MAKRGPQSELNHDNWDQEEDSVEAGVFKTADQDTIKGRTIRRAKRKVVKAHKKESTGEDDEDDEKPSIPFKCFGGFSGFGVSGPSSSSTPKPAFSFNPKPVASKSETKSSTTVSPSSSTTSVRSDDKTSIASEEEKPVNEPQKGKLSPVYLSHLRALNESVIRWLQTHMQKNAYCILTPVFHDYEHHLANLDATFKVNQPNDASTSSTASKATTTKPQLTFPPAATAISSPFTFMPGATRSAPGAFVFGKSTAGTKHVSFSGNDFNFGASSSETNGGPGATTSAPSFSFAAATATTGGANESTLKAAGFTFKPFAAKSGEKAVVDPMKPSTSGAVQMAGFSFKPSTSTAGPSTSAGAKDGDEDEYVPPKNEVTEVHEEEAYYTKRCKLFFKKGNEWAEKGVGNMHLKKCAGDKTQLIVRAATTLGNVLLNILITKDMPFNRQGKNNVMFMCLPNPPLTTKPSEQRPVSMLLKVKTGEDADELLELIKKSQAE